MSSSTVLVDAPWVLEQRLDDTGVVLVEVDEESDRLLTRTTSAAPSSSTGGHDLRIPLRRDFIDKAASRPCCRAQGIANDDTVVLYGGNNNWFAAYAYWYFKLYGHRDVRLLDGGRKTWELDERPLTGPARREPTTRTAPKNPTPRSARSATRSSRHRDQGHRRRPVPRRVLRRDPRARRTSPRSSPRSPVTSRAR